MDEKLKHKVLTEIDNDFENHVALLQSLIRIPSVNPWFKDNPEFYGEQRVQEEFKRVFIDMDASEIDMWEPSAKDLEHRKNGPGFYPGRDFTGRPNLVAKFNGSDPSRPALMIQGHCDVVSVGSKWTKDPFGARRKGGSYFSIDSARARQRHSRSNRQRSSGIGTGG